MKWHRDINVDIMIVKSDSDVQSFDINKRGNPPPK